jgi:hypothetical protein
MQVSFQYVDLDINYLTIILKLSIEFIVKYTMQMSLLQKLIN